MAPGSASDARVQAIGTGTSVALAGRPAGWPEDVPIPEGVEIDGVRCSNRYCTLWFGLMDFDQVFALKRQYIALIRNSGKWEQLGTPGDIYESEAYRYTGMPPSGCGYTWEIRHGQIPNDYYHRWRVFITLTW